MLHRSVDIDMNWVLKKRCHQEKLGVVSSTLSVVFYVELDDATSKCCYRYELGTRVGGCLELTHVCFHILLLNQTWRGKVNPKP